MSFQLTGSGPEIYENTMVPLWFERWAKALLAQVALQSGERVLDVACGTGVTTRIAKRDVGDGRFVGLDINAGMIEKARTLAPDMDIEWIESDVVGTAFRSNDFDAIISQHGYHYFPDQPAALAEFHRLLAPSGRIAMSIWDGHSPYTQALCAAVETHISPQIAAKQRSQRETPSADELIAHLRDAGFRDVEVIRQELAIKVPLAREFVPLHLGSMPIAGAFQSLATSQQEALIEDVEQRLAAFVQGDQLVYVDVVNVVAGVK
ncbi:ubiquinone/menaquinone biosynthesis methyltransferase [Amylibacter ulvae]|uniref:Ubiquinone/menaquinone biosynthesis methyltransferase n=1 Tax=Paramylibacter ulvae TaxID=1651968 RepID=A0ABQ3D784_9RHOB|nr:methyltransferase domain-containing protein [Amylibacter ulvae]GHA59000.1 ubiquinone/menaquinone biosynthesis methyltransferase [Amylibacter ulvae]